MKKICFISIDIERDNWGDKNTFRGVENLDNILDIFEKYKIKATLFVTGKVLEKYPGLVKKWDRKHEIGCHNYEHVELENIELSEREKQIKKFIKLYKEILEKKPKGFRAPRNSIDNEQFPILETQGFLYDSSVFSRYPWPIQRYEGYRGRAPIMPYWPSKKDYKKSSTKEEVKLFEIPEAPITFFGLPLLNIPLVATWLRKWTPLIFKLIFTFRKPRYISFNMHSWDSLSKFPSQLDEMLGFFKKIGYEFKSGEQIYEEFSKDR